MTFALLPPTAAELTMTGLIVGGIILAVSVIVTGVIYGIRHVKSLRRPKRRGTFISVEDAPVRGNGGRRATFIPVIGEITK